MTTSPVVWLGLPVVALVWLRRRGEALGLPALHGARESLELAGPEVAVMGVLHLVCTALGCYLVVITVAGIVLRCLHAPGATRVVDACTPPPLRRLVRAVACLAMTATATVSAATSSAAHGDAAPARSVTTAPPEAAPSEPVTMSRILETAPEGDPVEMRLLPVEHPAASSLGPGQRVIVSGDHFWSIAEDELARARSRPVCDAEIDPYWRMLVDANRAEVADPDLLFPGQVVRVPDVPADG